MCFADDRFIVAWVPEDCIGRVESGIDVNIGDCIGWAERRETAFTRTLRGSGYLVGR